MDDPTTAGVTEGFGLMFFQARWYDPGLGRFAQADSIVPPGAQGLDRYAYVRNNPLSYVDPTGHYESCPELPGGKCPKDKPQPDIPLTNKGDLGRCELVGGKPNCDGVRMYKLYKALGFTSPYDFLAWALLIEANGDQTLLQYITQIVAQRIWGTHVNAIGESDVLPSCPTSTCVNGIFNYLGQYSESAWRRYNSMIAGDMSSAKANPPGMGGMSSVAKELANEQKWRKNYGNNSPMHWGTYYFDPNKSSAPGLSWVPTMLGYYRKHDPGFGTDPYQVVYMIGDESALTVVFTINQNATWGGMR